MSKSYGYHVCAIEIEDEFSLSGPGDMRPSSVRITASAATGDRDVQHQFVVPGDESRDYYIGQFIAVKHA